MPRKPESDLSTFKAQILAELRAQIKAEAAEASAAATKALAGETQDEKAKREYREAVHAKFQEATHGEDTLHIVATSFRKFAEHLHDGKSPQRACQMVAEELEHIAEEVSTIVPPKSVPSEEPVAESTA